jgi:hypothetical protein
MTDSDDGNPTTVSRVDFLSSWFTDLGEDISSPKTAAMIALCKGIGIFSFEDMQIVASDYMASLPVGVPPVVAFRVQQLLQREDLVAEPDKITSFFCIQRSTSRTDSDPANIRHDSAEREIAQDSPRQIQHPSTHIGIFQC